MGKVKAVDKREGVRTLLWDIETSPIQGNTWGIWDQNVVWMDRDWHLLSFAWKWLGDKKVQSLSLPDFELFDKDPRDDYALVNEAYNLFNQADQVVAHNGVAFDTKKAKARMIIQGFDPPSTFKEVDTLKIARKYFAFTSNRLDDLCKSLKIGEKLDTGGWELWRDCLNGEQAAWKTMVEYNIHDVELLEELYERLIPWASVTPNLATISGRPNACPVCGSEEGMNARGLYYTAVMTRQRWQCKSCKSWTSSRKSEKTETLYVSI